MQGPGFRSRLGRVFAVSLALWLLLRLLSHGGPAGGVSYSQAVYDRNGQLLRLTLSQDQKYRKFTPLNEMSPAISEAILMREDRFFYYHPGVNPIAFAKATHGYLLQGDLRGASTITMQLARLLYGMRTRTIHGKLAQVAAAIYLELRYDKRSILEAYLNLIPLGHNIEGVPAASLIYFHKPPSTLNPVEAITLCVIPPSPGRRTGSSAHAQIEVDRFRNRLFNEWKERHPGDRDLFIQAERAIRPATPLPFAAPHFVDWVLSLQEHATGEIRTSLHLPFQNAMERALTTYVEEKASAGIVNGAALLIESSSGRILGHVGSASYFDDRIHGQVDGTRARRSPGSALKPLLYALAIDRGLIHSKTILKDAPVQFSTFSPENFEGEFLGPLPADSALVLSRNVPAIQLAARIQKPDFYDFLKKGGVSLPRAREYYGLAPILGGVEITMHQLASLYAALAGGTQRPTTPDRDGHTTGPELFSPQASFVALQMLRSQEGLSSRGQWNPVSVYWKTGTSSGFRDAWTAGVFGPYVLVVWIGNFDGSPNPAFIGREAAAPLFFRIVEAIRSEDRSLRDLLEAPPGVARIEVCSVSGKMPHPFCPTRVEAWYVPGKSPVDFCDVHREVKIDASTGLRDCGGSSNTRKEVFEFWPSDIEKLFQQTGVPRKLAPPYSPGCRGAGNMESAPVSITLPVRGVSYKIQREGEEIGLQAIARSAGTPLYWFLDDTYLGTGPAGEPFFWKGRTGHFRLRVVDPTGGSDEMDFRVSD